MHGAAQKSRARATCHRWAAAGALRLDEIYALGVHYDEDEPASADTLLVRLRPGRVEGVAPFPGHGRGVVVARDGVYVLDGQGVLHLERGGRFAAVLSDVQSICGSGSVLAIGKDGAFRLHDGNSTPLACHGAPTALQGCGDTVVYTDAAGLWLEDGGGRKSVPLPASDAGEAPIGALDVDERGALIATRGKQLLRGDASGLVVVGEARSPLHAVALFDGAGFAGSRALGLFRHDDDGFRSIRPSLRAHGLRRVADGLIVVSDLLLSSSSDGVDFVGRDLAPYVRLSDAR